jgi:transcriptional regulator with GAF, ATPase, and Fis domain/tetratricopeptide (TPR) repeat protein
MADEANRKVEQLKEQLAQATDVKSRLAALEGLTWALYYSSPRESERYLRQSIEVARDAGDWGFAGWALGDLAYMKFMLGELADAVEIANQGLALGREHNAGKAQATALNVLGLFFWQKGEHKKAIEHWDECMRVSRECNYEGGVVTALGNLALSYFSQGKYEKALVCFEELLPLQERLAAQYPSMRGAIATTYINIAQCCEELGDWERALESDYRGIALAEQLDQKTTIAEGRASLGSLFWKRGRNEEALRLFKSALEVATEVGHKDLVAEILGRMAEVHLAAGDFLAARNCLDLCRTKANELEDRKEIALAHRRSAELWRDYPDLVKAREEIEQALTLNAELGHRIEQGVSLRVKAEIMSAAGEREPAKEAFEQAIALLSARENEEPGSGARDQGSGAAPRPPTPDPRPLTPGYSYSLAQAHFAFARFLAGRADNAAAADNVSQAAMLFRKLGVLQLAEDANRFLLMLRSRTGTAEDTWLAILQTLSGLAGSSSPLSEMALSCLRLLTEGFGFQRGAFVLYGRQHYTVGKVPMQALLAAPRNRELSLTPEAVRIPVFLRSRHIGVAYLDGRDPDVALPPLAFWQTVQDLLMLASERLRRRLQPADAGPAAEGSTIRVPEPDAAGHQTRFGAIIAVSPAMNQLLDTVEKVARTRASVLVCGASGTGKEMVARALHGLSPRQAQPLVIINCAALPETLLEAELFGIEKGVATGVQARAGKLEQADGGTVFLDEIGDMSLLLQTKLLRAVQERSFERVGGSKTITVDVRFIAATNRDLAKAVKSGEFREDLYHRLNVITLELPPLRERPEEIPLMVEHFVRTYSEEFMRPVHALTSSAMDFLLKYAWPGNVRELRNVIERAVILAKEGVIAAEDLPPALHAAPATQRRPRATKLKEAKREAREETGGSVEKESILKALEEHDWQIPAVMAALGVSRSHLYRLMHRYGLKREKKA